jgi:hypothetical protein
LEELLQEQIYDENDRMEKEAEKIARWVGRKWQHLKRHRELAAAGKRVSMGEVVAEVMAPHGKETTANETSSLLDKGEAEESRATGSSGFMGFFQSLAKLGSGEET